MLHPVIASREVTRYILQAFHLKAKKKFGQNFLINEQVVRGIAEKSQIGPGDLVVEIGPGIGTLTQALAETGADVKSVEIDRSLLPVLAQTLQGYDNVEIVPGDVLKLNLAKVTEHRPFTVAANLPYYITTPIIFALLEQELPLKRLVVMVQKEVAERMTAQPGGKDYGPLSLALQYYSKPELAKKKRLFIYRVHDVPDAEKIRDLGKLMALFGVNLKTQEQVKPKDLQRALDKMTGRPEEKLVSTVALRSMKQAVYQVENIGHFGLAARYYTHFTSPIRRYPDLLVHRLLRKQLDGERLTRQKAEDRIRQLEQAAQHCSQRERAAIDAERQTVDLKMAEYMLQFVGEEFTGTISGVSSFGFFVELENGVEGLVHISSLTDDYYDYLEGQYALVGQHLGKQYRLGDEVRIQVLQVDISERKIDFVLAGLSPEAMATMRQDLSRQKRTKTGIATGTLKHKTTGRSDSKKKHTNHPHKKRRRKKNYGKGSESHRRKPQGKA